ncbi:coiled-coil domain-containing protein 42-like [Strix aluco]|uniref:coiled-coil domain-containing protein 42-like n=1 Tax=Strix aluco TaxID=111821 RepID=UPI003DA41A60
MVDLRGNREGTMGTSGHSHDWGKDGPGKRRQEAPRGSPPARLPFPLLSSQACRAAPGLTWESSSARRTWALWALLVAGVIATMEDEDLLAYFRTHYKQHLPPLLRELGLTEEDSPSPFIRLQKKKRQDQLMHKVLEVKEEAFRERMKVISCRWRDLHAKEAQLKTYMEKSGKILKENDKIQMKALKRAGKEREMKIQKESELLRAKRELEALRNEHRKLSNKVQKYSIFNQYLEDVVKISQFEEIQDVIRRYRMPLRTHKHLLQAQQGYKEMSKQAKVLLDQYTAEKEAEILQYKNELAQLQLCFDQAQSDILSWETSWANIQNTTRKKTLKLGTIKLAILSLFQCMSTQLKANPNVPMDDSHRQLDMIQRFIRDFTEIAMEVKQKDMQNRQRASTPTEL